jgi:hypothetical protein
MRQRTRFSITALAAASVLAVCVGAVSANRIAQSNQTYRATWSSLEFVSAFATVRCPVTIEGSFHSRTFSKVAELLVGYTYRAAAGTCTGGTVTIRTETLPWHVRYNNFTGTLPNIVSAGHRIVGVGFVIEALGTRCSYSSTAASPMKSISNRNTATHAVESIRIDETAVVPLGSGSFTCSSSGRIAGTTNTVVVPGTTTKITVTLVQ